jgi:hypothetical protein
MMENMEVVVEEQQTEQRAVFNDGRAFVVMIGKAVFGIGAQPAEGRAAVDESQQIKPNRDLANCANPIKNDRDADEMPRL